MMKIVSKLLKIILIVLIVSNMIAIINIKCYADYHMRDPEEGSSETTPSSGGITDVTENPGSWKPTGTATSTTFNEKVGNILGIISVIGTIATVVSLSLIGIKFMLGSAEEKASYKQTLMPWLIGAILVFAMTTIPATLYNISNGLFKEPSTSGGAGKPTLWPDGPNMDVTVEEK